MTPKRLEQGTFVRKQARINLCHSPRKLGGFTEDALVTNEDRMQSQQIWNIQSVRLYHRISKSVSFHCVSKLLPQWFLSSVLQHAHTFPSFWSENRGCPGHACQGGSLVSPKYQRTINHFLDTKITYQTWSTALDQVCGHKANVLSMTWWIWGATQQAQWQLWPWLQSQSSEAHSGRVCCCP